MKIVIVIDDLDLSHGGGVGSFLFDLCMTMYEKKLNISIISIISSKDNNDSMCNELKKKIPVYYIGAKNRRDAILNFIKYALITRDKIKEISNGELTICNLHLKLSTLYGAIATIGLKNIKCIETYHSNYKNYFFINKSLSFRINKYIACSFSAGEELKKKYYIAKEKIEVIPNGIRHDYSCNINNQKTQKNNKLKILSVGRLSYEKNFETTIKAFLTLKEDFCYRLVGEGILKDKLKKIANNNKHINMIGSLERKEVLTEINSADIVVMPSLWEGLSIFMLEAMAFGKPLILSDIPSFRTVFEEKELLDSEKWRCCSWGYLVKKDSVDGYREALENFIKNRDSWRNMSNNVLLISAKYDIEYTVKKYIQIFNEVINNE